MAGSICIPAFVSESRSSENEHAECRELKNAELTIYLHSLEIHAILGPGNGPDFGVLCMSLGNFMKRGVDVRLSVDRNLKFSTLVTMQGTYRTGNSPRHLLYRFPEVPAPEQTTF